MHSDAAAAARAFGLDPADAISLCRYGHVFRFGSGSGAVVLKRTGAVNSGAVPIANWLRDLAMRGIPVVTPDPRYAPNPRLGLSGAWVVYPFIEGEPYTGSHPQIVAAARLLARLHRVGAHLGAGMRIIRRLPMRDEDWRSRHLKLALDASARAGLTLAAMLDARAAQHRVDEAIFARAWLPIVACSWDYKASNLVFAADGPVLVDPDHAGSIPRLYDLACAVLIFHCDCPDAPARPFTPEEWAWFRDAYTASVVLSRHERELWPLVLRAAWMDQAVWLLGSWPERWADPFFRKFLTAIATYDLDEIAV